MVDGRRSWFVVLLLAACASSREPGSARSNRPLCAQPVAEGKCLEGTWPATRRDGKWDCKIIQDQLELDGIPADRCGSFITERELAEQLRTLGRAR